MTKFGRLSSYITGILVSILLVIFGEGIFISSISTIGPILTFIIFLPILTLISIFIIYSMYLSNTKLSIIKAVKQWGRKKIGQQGPTVKKIIGFSQNLGLIFLVLTAGPILTSVFTGFLKTNYTSAIVASVYLNIIFLIFWIAIYSGVVALIKSYILNL